MKKTINVVAAIIVRDGRVFATQRGYGEWKDWWEFPGGKIEQGEAPGDARWLSIDELDSVKWLPADLEILPLLRRALMESRA